MYHIFVYKELSWEPFMSTPHKYRAYNTAKGISFRHITKLVKDDELIGTYYLGRDYVE
jgi:hypothetical protein